MGFAPAITSAGAIGLGLATVLGEIERRRSHIHTEQETRVDRPIPSNIVEQWMTHLRLQRSRARDMIWMIENGATLHDGREGRPLHDATARWLEEQKEVVAEVDRLVGLYDGING